MADQAGTDGGTGTGIIEIYDPDLAADSRLANISTRAFVGDGDDIVIATPTGPVEVYSRGPAP